MKDRSPPVFAILATLTAALLLAASFAYAQFRTIPPDAKRASVGQQKYPLPYVDLNGTAVKLAPGGIIYDENNRSIVHGALPAGAEVAVTRDMHGDIGRMYILTPQEQATFGKK